jgi:hypothetical protein
MNHFLKYHFDQVPTTHCTKVLHDVPEARSSEVVPYTAAPVSRAGARHMTTGVPTIQLNMSKPCPLHVSTVTAATCCVDIERAENYHTPHRHATHPQTAPWAQWSSCLGDVQLGSKKKGITSTWTVGQQSEGWFMTSGHCSNVYIVYTHGLVNSFQHTEL